MYFSYRDDPYVEPERYNLAGYFAHTFISALLSDVVVVYICVRARQPDACTTV